MSRGNTQVLVKQPIDDIASGRKAAAKASTSAEPKAAVSSGPLSQPEAGAASEIFLSPRVVDREAFNDFSQTLRHLISEAQSNAAALKVAGEQAESARIGLNELVARHQAATASGAKVLSGLDQRAGEGERVYAAAKEAAATLEAIKKTTTGAAEESRDLVARLVSEAVERAAREFEGRLEELRQRAERAFEARLADAAGAAELRTVEGARTLTETAGQCWSRLGEARLNAERGLEETTRQGSSRLRTEIDAAIERLLLLRDGATDRVSEATASIEAAGAVAREGVAAAANEAAQVLRGSRFEGIASIERLITRLSEERAGGDEVARRLEEMLGEAEAVIGAAELAGDGDEPVQVPGSLGDLLGKVNVSTAQAQKAVAEAHRAVSEATLLRGRADESRAALAAEIDRARAEQDELAGSTVVVVNQLQQLVASIRAAR